MKKSILLILLFILSACSRIYFDQPQPENEKILKIVPKELTGKWIEKDVTGIDDTIYITKRGQTNIKVEIDSLKKIIITKENNFLSDSLILKKSGEYYVINQREENVWGIIYIVKKEKNGDIVFYNPNHFPFFGDREGLKVDKLEVGHDSIINIESLEKIKIPDSTTKEYVHYKGFLKPKDIKKIILPQNIEFTLKKNGTVTLTN